ncbi:PREDICTED: ventricular zone-expressed PH domain-containing protein homolog 1 isoform X4 [Rhinopithecus bieti]|uniref:ventricular zone-expressed PH domain-containing protein homolog 1 isoform X4 n=1 Tax=Rhinopithecus bieti TaxID=61621 RepID=UPI00083BF11E|nr:PREDICTED: ventricular zone-expressed PH domain-containing protein homolog 1 isoform X4 [Rhinopithecus bieti]
MLLRVLPAVYEKQPQPINRHLTELLALMSQLEQPEQYHLLRLLHVAAKKKQLEDTCSTSRASLELEDTQRETRGCQEEGIRNGFLRVVQKCIPFLIGHLKDSTHNDITLNILIEIAGYEPVALNGFLPMLKEVGERFPYLIGQMARIYGAVGHVDEQTPWFDL